MISNRASAKQYGYDESTVRQWHEKEVPIGEGVDESLTRILDSDSVRTSKNK